MSSKPRQPRVRAVKLVSTYAHGWLWVEIADTGQWRLRFGEPGRYVYMRWQNPILNDNARSIFIHGLVSHYERIYNPPKK